MRQTLKATASLAALLCVFTLSPLLCSAGDTVFFVVRHAEKADMTDATHLSTAGMNRAEQLAQTLQNLRVTAIYRTAKVRSKETAQPLATKLSLTPIEYDDPTQAWVDSVVAAQAGKSTLIVGHSDTLHKIVGRLIGTTVPEIGDHYDNLFVVTISGTDKRVVQLKYGAAN